MRSVLALSQDLPAGSPLYTLTPFMLGRYHMGVFSLEERYSELAYHMFILHTLAMGPVMCSGLGGYGNEALASQCSWSSRKHRCTTGH